MRVPVSPTLLSPVVAWGILGQAMPQAQPRCVTL